MGSGGVPGRTYIADLLPRVDVVARLHGGGRKVCVPGLDAVAMANGHEVAVGAGRACLNDGTGGGGRHGRAGLGREVEARVLDLLVLDRIDAVAVTRGGRSGDRH